MDTLTLETNYFPHLAGQFATGSAVLFLGAGFSLGARTISRDDVPSGAQLTKLLWDLCFPSEPYDPTTQLQDIFETALGQKPKDLANLLSRYFTVDPKSIKDWQRAVLTMPWLRIYTLNIDDLATQVLSMERGSRDVRVASALTDTNPLFDDSKLSLIHLNGQLSDSPLRVTFSRSQYAHRREVEPAYTQLRNDLLFRSVVFIGSSLEEASMWEHLEMRGSRGARGDRELRPRSYLVVPSLNKSKESLLARYNVAWLPMYGDAFSQQIIARLADARTAGHQLLRQRAGLSHGAGRVIPRVADLAAIAKPTEEYLLGAEPTWNDVTANKVAGRECFEEVWTHITEIRANPSKPRFLVITGTAGTGKSSALMVTAMRLEAEGIRVGWMDANSFFTRRHFIEALVDAPDLGALFINDADIYDSRMSSMVRDALNHNKRLVMVCEARSTRVDRVVNRYELGDVHAVEFSIPPLCDSDIDGVLDVLDREHRLGRLKGLDRNQRRTIFKSLSGRQLLVAMHIATHGRDFQEKAKDELKELIGLEQFIYGLVSVASAHRFSLRQEDIGIACSDETTEWLQKLDSLVRRKLVIPHGDSTFRARHRIIAQFAYDSLVEEGKLHEIVRSLIKIGATKTTRFSPKESQHARLLRMFINHEQMKRWVGEVQARNIYGEFEEALSWNHHFWLHRGALELETNNLGLAENFLAQAKSINPADVFVDNELAYLSFKKAIAHPTDTASAALIEEAIATLNDIAARRPDQVAHTFHILGSQGLLWAQSGISDPDRKKEFLEYIKRKAQIAFDQQPTEMFRNLCDDIQRALLAIAI